MITQTSVKIEIKKKLQEPSKFQVLLLNDDYTTMEFVIKILVKFFHKSEADASKLMMQIHKKGEATCGVYPYDIAQTKVEQVISFSRENEHPLMCVLRKE